MHAPHLPPASLARLERASLSLEGLSIGDAFGERCLVGDLRRGAELPEGPWPTTDDTEMALGIVEVLVRAGRIDQDDLARTFGERYRRDPSRGYGETSHRILSAIADGASWRDASRAAFGGMGSMGNGGAMRVAPLGAWWADELGVAVEEARASAEVTHAHPEGQAGAIAVAVAAAWAFRSRTQPRRAEDLLTSAIEHTPPGETRQGLMRALELPPSVPVADAADVLGNGSGVIAADTVPLALWVAAHHLRSFEDALWTMASAGGDVDTNCAIVGGIVALAVGAEGIPEAFKRAREPLYVGLD